MTTEEQKTVAASNLPPMTREDWQHMAELSHSYGLPLAAEIFERRVREMDAEAAPAPTTQPKN